MNEIKQIQYSFHIMKFSTVHFVLENQQGVSIFSHTKLEATSIPNPYPNKHSSSVILSLAEYLSHTFPTLPPPGSVLTIPISEVYAANLWIKSLVEAVENSDALRHQETLHIKFKITVQYSNKLVKLKFTHKQLPEFRWNQCCSTLTKIEVPVKSKNYKILMCLCNQVKEHQDIKDISLPAIYMGLFYNNQSWKVFKIISGQIPTTEELEEASVVIVPGSDLSVYNRNENVQKFKSNLLPATQSNPKLKYLGICFGMQFICDVFGGKVQKAQKYTATVEKIFLNKQLLKKYYGLHNEWKHHEQLAITSYHGDEVVEVPKTFEVLAHSSSCKVEVVMSTDHRFLGIQGHPDYSVEYIEHYNLSKEENESNRFTHLFRDQFEQTRKAIRAFLSHDIQGSAL